MHSGIFVKIPGIAFLFSLPTELTERLEQATRFQNLVREACRDSLIMLAIDATRSMWWLLEAFY